MAGAERPGEPHGRRRSAGRRRPGGPDRRGAANGEEPAPTADPGCGGRDAGAPNGVNNGVQIMGGETSGEGGDTAPEGHRDRRRVVGSYIRANPQVFVLLVICLVLGLCTFLAVVFGPFTAGSGQTTGEPSGAILGLHLLAPPS